MAAEAIDVREDLARKSDSLQAPNRRESPLVPKRNEPVRSPAVEGRRVPRETQTRGDRPTGKTSAHPLIAVSGERESLRSTSCWGWSVVLSTLTHIVLLVALVLVVVPLAVEDGRNVVLSSAFQEESPRLETPTLQIADMAREAAQESRVANPTREPDSATLRVPAIQGPRLASRGNAAGQPGQSGGALATPRPDPASQTSFFGTVAYGNRFVFILDVSSSMSIPSVEGQQTRLQRALRELANSLNSLREDQEFYVFLFSGGTRYMRDRRVVAPVLVRATPENKQEVIGWLRSTQPGGHTDPRTAIRLSLAMQPDAIFLLSDGEFNYSGGRSRLPDGRVFELIETHRGADTVMHTIAFEDPINEKTLSAIASRTSGTHRFVGPDESGSKAKAILAMADATHPSLLGQRLDYYLRVLEECPDDTAECLRAQRRITAICATPGKQIEVGRELYQLARQREKEGVWDAARMRYQLLIRFFPKLNVARAARKNLEELKQTQSTEPPEAAGES